jgi:hypothetical protein
MADIIAAGPSRFGNTAVCVNSSFQSPCGWPLSSVLRNVRSASFALSAGASGVLAIRTRQHDDAGQPLGGICTGVALRIFGVKCSNWSRQGLHALHQCWVD